MHHENPILNQRLQLVVQEVFEMEYEHPGCCEIQESYLILGWKALVWATGAHKEQPGAAYLAAGMAGMK